MIQKPFTNHISHIECSGDFLDLIQILTLCSAFLEYHTTICMEIFCGQQNSIKCLLGSRKTAHGLTPIHVPQKTLIYGRYR